MINWGIIGLGNAAKQFALGFNDLTNSNLLAVASKTKEKLNFFKDKFKLDDKYCFSKYEDLINCKEIDIIYIALPHNFHFTWIINCLEQNKNVLVEKPATTKLEEMQNINRIVEQKKLFFAEGFMYRFHPQTKKIINLIQSGEIGNLLSMESNFGVNLLNKKKFFGLVKKKVDYRNRLFNKSLAGGCIYDLGCYPSSLSILISQIKDENNLNYELKKKKKEYGYTNIDIDSYVDIIFSNGFKSHIGCSFNKNLGKSTKINGTKGYIHVEDTWHCIKSKIILNDKKIKNDQLDFNNIFSFEINSISKSLLKNEKQPEFPAISKKDSEMNIKILEEWISDS